MYLDVKVEGESVGRIVVELADDVKVGAQRFADLAEGKQGVGYRLSKFDGIFNVSNTSLWEQVAVRLPVIASTDFLAQGVAAALGTEVQLCMTTQHYAGPRAVLLLSCTSSIL